MPEDRILGPALITISGVIGLYVGARRRLLNVLVEQAKAEERVRLASEMHDVVTHRINLMVLQAGALRVTTKDDTVKEAAENLRSAGTQALAELRDLVGVLRNEQSLEDLVTTAKAAGVNVELTQEGSQERVAPTVRRTLFRVVQESLTNATKHAPGSRVDVHVRYAPDKLYVTVHNSPATRDKDQALAEAGAGSGLEGLRHRIKLVGGKFDANPTTEGGFVVRAELPP